MEDPHKISGRDVTDPAIYFNRRAFMRAGLLAASAVATGVVYRCLNPAGHGQVKTPVISGVTKPAATNATAAGFSVNEPETSFENITHYNNFYEFSTDKEGVAPAAESFDTKGWQVSVEGLVNKPQVFDLDDLL